MSSQPESCIEEWPEFKLRANEIRIHQQNNYLNANKDNPALAKVALLRIIFVIPVQTATLERGFPLIKRTKTDWWNRLSPKSLSELNLSLKTIMKWWQAGPRSHGIAPYRHHSESETSESEEGI